MTYRKLLPSLEPYSTLVRMSSKPPPSRTYKLDAATWPEFEREAKKAGLRQEDRYLAFVWAKQKQADGRWWLSAHQAVAAWLITGMARPSAPLESTDDPPARQQSTP